MADQSRVWILHHYPYRDTSMLIEALTEPDGRLGLVARGVRRRGNRDRGILAPFQPLLMRWSGRGELRTMTEVECERWLPAPQGRNLIAGYYCNELLLRLLRRGQEEPGVFAAYCTVIEALRTDAQPERALRVFEMALLENLGYAPPLALEADSGASVEPDAIYDFHPGHGPVRAAGSAASSSVRVSGTHLLAIARHEFDDPDVLRSARALLRRSLEPHLGAQPLRTRALYRQMYGRSIHDT